jgi:hypothetical protein
MGLLYLFFFYLVKPEIVTYIYEPTFGYVESRLFKFSSQCFNIDSMQKVFLCYICV